MQGTDGPWAAWPSPAECLSRTRQAAKQLLASRQDSFPLWAAYAQLEQRAGNVKVS